MKGHIKKSDLYTEWQADNDKFKDLTDRLFKLVNEEKITSGCLLVYAWSHSYYYKVLADIFYKGWKREATRVSLIQRWMESYKEEIAKAEAFIIENEQVSMEDCQRTRVMKEKEERGE